MLTATLKTNQYKGNILDTIKIWWGSNNKGKFAFYCNNSTALKVSFACQCFMFDAFYLSNVKILHICLHAFVVSSQQILPSSSATFCMVQIYKKQHNYQFHINIQFQWQFSKQIWINQLFSLLYLTQKKTFKTSDRDFYWLHILPSINQQRQSNDWNSIFICLNAKFCYTNST